jgi:hypothetical protein
MDFSVATNFDECTLMITVLTAAPVKIRLMVADANIPNTLYTDRYKTVEGKVTFEVGMPVCGKSCIVSLYNEAYGNTANDNSFRVISIDKEPLQQKLSLIDYTNPYISSFINFCTRFCFNAGWIEDGIYVSDDKKFVIKYVPRIEDGGVEQTTPARIGVDDGVIEVSQRHFVPYTVPNRMAILLHEFSHIWINDNLDDEVEADLNSLLIYLALGYPRIEAFEVFGKAFDNAPTAQNQKRYDKMKEFIDYFDKTNKN